MSWFRQQTDGGFPRIPEDVLHLYESSPDDWTPLPPPRPPFMMTSANRSWSSITLSTSSDHSLSDRERSPTTSMSAPAPPPLSKSASHRKLRRSSSGGDYAQDILDGHNDQLILMRRPPPSAFKLPFQSHPGNPDPLPPRSSSRASLDSLPSSTRDDDALPPNAPPVGAPPTPLSGTSDVYRNSVAGNMAHESQTNLPRTGSTPSFRSPFLSPASRPSSTIWSPPIQPLYGGGGTPNASTHQLGPVKKFKPPMPSTMLSEKLTGTDKSWLQGRKGDRPRLSWWLTILMWFIGLCAGVVKIYFDYKSIHVLDDSQLCPVFAENFDSLNLNDWTPDVQLSGFGNNEFEMTTTFDKNLFVQNGQLYIHPTLTSDEIGNDAIFNGGSYKLDGCTNSSSSACSVTSDSSRKLVIPPVQSARISTKNSYSIRYGKVEVKAKLPRGDWLWPAVWMLPVDSVYGAWPASGEIDIMEARGNNINYRGQGVNYVRSSLNYGPMSTIMARIYGWQSQKRVGYDNGFHTYTLEWTDKWMRVSVDNRINAMIDLSVARKGKSFWDRGKFPKTTQNGSSEVVVDQLYNNPSAPFDQSFYLIINLSVGGTSGWFPDEVGDKPWFDSSNTAKYDFAAAQSTWASTWPSDVDQRAFRIDSVKMWKLGGC